jgi:hypothetical protein
LVDDQTAAIKDIVHGLKTAADAASTKINELQSNFAGKCKTLILDAYIFVLENLVSLTGKQRGSQGGQQRSTAWCYEWYVAFIFPRFSLAMPAYREVAVSTPHAWGLLDDPNVAELIQNRSTWSNSNFRCFVASGSTYVENPKSLFCVGVPSTFTTCVKKTFLRIQADRATTFDHNVPDCSKSASKSAATDQYRPRSRSPVSRRPGSAGHGRR